jgi:hypothetical protein
MAPVAGKSVLSKAKARLEWCLLAPPPLDKRGFLEKGLGGFIKRK